MSRDFASLSAILSLALAWAPPALADTGTRPASCNPILEAALREDYARTILPKRADWEDTHRAAEDVSRLAHEVLQRLGASQRYLAAEYLSGDYAASDMRDRMQALIDSLRNDPAFFHTDCRGAEAEKLDTEDFHVCLRPSDRGEPTWYISARPPFVHASDAPTIMVTSQPAEDRGMALVIAPDNDAATPRPRIAVRICSAFHSTEGTGHGVCHELDMTEIAANNAPAPERVLSENHQDERFPSADDYVAQHLHCRPPGNVIVLPPLDLRAGPPVSELTRPARRAEPRAATGGSVTAAGRATTP